MRKQWIAMGLILALALAACLSMPVLAEKLIDDSVDKVTVESETDNVERKRTTTTEAPQPVPLSDAAKAKIEAHGRKAYQDAFGEAIPAEYKPLDLRAYESDEGDGSLGCVLSLMPEGWEGVIDTLSSGERRPFYSIQFGNVNAETGEAVLLGAQKYYLMVSEGEVDEPKIEEAAETAMEAAARKFAEEMGYEAGDLVNTTKVSGSYDPGLSMEFSIGEGKTLTLTVALDGTVNGYSLVPGKG